MPPLLPEYLNQPTQIVIQSSVDWQVWVGAGATLLGAAIGAGLGAFFSYGAAKKASQRAFALEKAEMLYALAESCRSDICKLDSFYLRGPSALYNAEQEKRHLLNEASERFDKLYEQLHIYAEDKNIDRRGLLDAHSIWRHILYRRFNPAEQSLQLLQKDLIYKSIGGYLAAKKNYDSKLASTCDELAHKVRHITGK